MTVRALLFCHDGTSLGHLQFLCRIADGLHPEIACLIATGMREISRLIPKTSEYVKLPSWDYLLQARAESRGSAFSFDLDDEQAMTFRSELLRSIGKGFDPDVIFVDYLPFGQKHELVGLLESTDAVKYFIHRGIPDTSDAKILVGEDASGRIARSYDRILVTLPPGFRDVALEDGYCADAAKRIEYVGFLAPANTAEPTHALRQQVVCSGGGGVNTSSMVESVVLAASQNPTADFTVVLGPRYDGRRVQPKSDNVTVIEWSGSLWELHQTADIVVCAGGYSTVVEAMRGRADIIILPNQRGLDDEQIRFASLLAKSRPLTVLKDASELDLAIKASLANKTIRPSHAPASWFRAGENIKRLALSDIHRRAKRARGSES
jgi:predicted glycosyltransferase